MGEESPFWEMVVTVAPLLALTIIVEFRSIKWGLIASWLKFTLVFYMVTSITLLGAAMMFSLTKLLWWGQPVYSETPWDPLLVLFAIYFAVAGVIIVPVVLTCIAALGPWLDRPYFDLRRERSRRDKVYKKRLRELSSLHHEVRLELTERVINNKGPLFVITIAPGELPQFTDVQVGVLLRKIRVLESYIARYYADHHKWRKKINRKLKKLQDKHPIQSTSDVLLMFTR